MTSLLTVTPILIERLAVTFTKDYLVDGHYKHTNHTEDPPAILKTILIILVSILETTLTSQSVSANLKVVHIGPKHVQIGHVLVQTIPKLG